MKTKTLLVALFISCFPTFMTAQTFTLVNMTNPDPNNNALMVVWSYDNNNIFAGGDNGTLLKYNGSSWSQIPVSFSDQILSIYGASPTDVWLVTYEGSLLRYNGSTVAKVDISNSNHLWKIIGFSANDIYICGDQGTFYHYNGTSWSQISTPSVNFLFRGMFGISSNNLYLTGEDLVYPYTRRMYYYDGSNLTEVINGNYGYGWSQVWSPDDNLFYIGGRELYRFNKTTNAVDQILDGNNVLYGFNANNIIVAKNNEWVDSLVIYDGSAWKTYPFGYMVSSICSPTNNPNNVFLVGAYGGISHLDLTTGISEQLQAPNKFDFYPNPASDQVTIELVFGQRVNIKIELFDLLGKRVKLVDKFEGNEFAATFSVSDLPSGSYFVKVTTDDGSSFNKKLMISK